ncbi:MAG: hypothetical protein JNM93_11145 [Bacteriovoracaceae bacterium]|nr:hypothetical protein [Bacteriovoracaceae bacterium]
MKWLVILMVGVSMLNVSAFELASNTKKDCMNCGSKLSGLEEVEKLEAQELQFKVYIHEYCSAIHVDNHTVLTEGQNSFILTHLEKKILNLGLGLDEKVVLKDLSEENIMKVLKKIDDYLQAVDFLNLTCPEGTTLHLLMGKRTFIEYMALSRIKTTFYRFFLSGAFSYDILTTKFPIAGKQQYYIDWLNDQINNNPDKLDHFSIKFLTENREVIYEEYPQLKTKYEAKNESRK